MNYLYKKHKQVKLLCLTFVIFTNFISYAQNDTLFLLKPTINELIKIDTLRSLEKTANIGSFKEAKVREIPGIISVIDNDFIVHSGARDLVDLLRMVPGFDFGRDVDDVVGVFLRGNWLLEGKILVMLNGLQMNETSYGGFAFKNHIPLEIIEKIEIVRGPGSTVYGGVASLAVINIITKTTSYNDGIDLSVKAGYADKKFSNKSVSLNFNHQFNNGVLYNLSGYINHSTQSNIIEPNRFNKPLNYIDSSGIKNEGFVSTFSYKNFNYNLIYDNYLLDISDSKSKLIMKNIINQFSYEIKPTKKISIKPEFIYKWHLPWVSYGGNQNSHDDLTLINNRVEGRLVASYLPNKNILFSLGCNYYNDKSQFENPNVVFYDGKNTINFSNSSFFGEAQLFSKFFNLTIGGRFDNHSVVNSAFVPRVAITKVFDKIHLKGLYNQSFKTPTIQNIDEGPEEIILPEKVQVIEFEAGYKLNNTFSFNINLFDNQIKKTIVYEYDNVTETGEYRNRGIIYNRGLEAELTAKNKLIEAQINFSTYSNYKNEVPETLIDSIRGKELAGAPTYKSTAYLKFNLPKKWSVGSSFIYTSGRKSYVYTNPSYSSLELKTFKPLTLLNVSIAKNELFTPQLRLDLSINNILNNKYYYVGAFSNGYNPLPDQRIEFNLRLTYKLGI